MSVLRKHWHLLPLIFIGLFWWRIVALTVPPLINPDVPLKDVDYWTIVANPNWFYLVVFGLGIVGFFSLIRAWLIGNVIYRSLVIVLLLFLFSSSTCAHILFAGESEERTIENLTTLEYKDKTYHLALSTNSQSRGVPEFDYLVFECDIAGKICSEILKTGGYGYDKQPVQLIVDGDRLVFDWYEKIQLLPALK